MLLSFVRRWMRPAPPAPQQIIDVEPDDPPRAADPAESRAAPPPVAEAAVGAPQGSPAPSAPPRPRVEVKAHEQVMRFGKWLRENDGAGWYSALDVLELYAGFCARAGLVEIDETTFLERFATSPGVWRGRRRMNAAEGPDMEKLRKRLALQAADTNPDRPTLYRVATPAEMAATVVRIRRKPVKGGNTAARVAGTAEPKRKAA